MKVAYKAIDRDGISVADTIEAPDITGAVETLRREGLFVTDIMEATGKEKKLRGSTRVMDAREGRLKLGELLFFTRQVSMLLKSGSPLVPALSSIGKQLKGPSRLVVDKLRTDMEQGRGLAESMKAFPGSFSAVYVAVVAAGELSASLPEMFSRLGAWVAYKREIRNRVLGSLIYPALLIVLSCSIITTMVGFVVPRFKSLFESLDAQLPVSTQIMFSVSFFVREHWAWLIVTAACLFLGIIVFFRQRYGRQVLSNLQTRIPLVGRLLGRMLQAQMFRMMGLLLESRVGIMETLNLARQISINRDYQGLCANMDGALERGGRFSAALLKSSFVSPSIAQAVSTGEESGHLDQAMLFVADVLDDENTQMVNTLTKLIEPAILIFMGMVVAGIAMSLFIPLFDLAAMAQ